MPFRRICIAGASVSGTGLSTGNAIAKKCLTEKKRIGCFDDVVVLGRKSTAPGKAEYVKELERLGARFVAVDYSDVEALTNAIRGCDCLLSCVAVQDPAAISESELNLVRAAKAAGTVRRFFPSKYGGDDENSKQLSDVGKRKKRVGDLLWELGITQTNVVTGIFYDVMYTRLVTKFQDLGKDPQTGADRGFRTALVGDGGGMVMGISVVDIANFVFEMLVCPDELLTSNRTVRILGDSWTPAQWVEMVRRVSGRPVTVTVYKDSKEAAKANAFFPLMFSRGDFAVKPELWDNHKWPNVKPIKFEDFTCEYFAQNRTSRI